MWVNIFNNYIATLNCYNLIIFKNTYCNLTDYIFHNVWKLYYNINIILLIVTLQVLSGNRARSLQIPEARFLAIDGLWLMAAQVTAWHHAAADG